MKIKTAELIGWQLDWAVCKVVGLIDAYPKHVGTANKFKKQWNLDEQTWLHPSTSRDNGGPIIEREFINLLGFKGGAHWTAERRCGDDPRFLTGPTPLIAAMRCFVASKLGDEVDVP